MDTADNFTGCIEVFNACHAVGCDVKTAVLVVESGVNKNRLFPDVDAVLAEHSHHSRNSCFDCAFSALQLNHRSVKPYSDAVSSVNAVSSCGAFANDGSRGYVTCFKRVHEYFAVCVDELCTERTYLFRYERAEDLFRISRAGRVVLECICIKELCADSVAEDKSVSRCAVVV